MLRTFKDDMLNPDQFVITLELVPGSDASARSVDHIRGIARDAFRDARISAVSITDNPGGNPSIISYGIGNTK